MTNITHTVWKLLDNHPSIRRCMSQGLINNTALAKYIIKEKKIDGTLDAISSAIRRYKFEKYDKIFDTANKIVSFGELSFMNDGQKDLAIQYYKKLRNTSWICYICNNEFC